MTSVSDGARTRLHVVSATPCAPGGVDLSLPARRHRVLPRNVRPCFFACIVLAVCGCGPIPLDDRLGAYRSEIESILDEGGSPFVPKPLPAFPGRRDRRLDVGDQRIGPFDFLATVGCRLSEVIAERNGALGRVLAPTRRLAHERAVLTAIEECLPALSEARAGRLRERLAAKQAEVGRHAWNAVWLDEDLERFLSGGPASLVGGRDSTDGAWQLMRASAAIEALDVDALEQAFAELRDDRAIGPMLRRWDGSIQELQRVAALVGSRPARGCDVEERRLAGVFRERYLPNQSGLAVLDKQGRALVRGIDRLARASAPAVEISPAMTRYLHGLLGEMNDRIAPGTDLASRSREGIVEHARAWGPLLEACGVIPGGSEDHA